MFQNGKSLKDIAVIRDVSQQTVEAHLFKAFKDGYPISWEIFFNEDDERTVLAARATLDEVKLKPLKETLPDTYDYTKIKAVLTKHGYM
nr:helix-turn-helix domain-containing protein [Virgibacillus salexigens]